MSPLANVKLLSNRPTVWQLIRGLTAVNLLLAAVSFLKDLSFASYFGTSREADLVTTAFLLPEAISYNLIAAVIGIAAVPELSRRWQEKQYGAYLRCTVWMTIHVTLLMIAIGALLLLTKNVMLHLFGYQSGSAEIAQLERLYTLLLIALPLFPLYAIGGAALQAAGSFYAAAAGPILLNVMMLSAIILSRFGGLSDRDGAFAYAVSILMGAAGMTLIVWTALRRKFQAEAGLSFTAAWKLKDVEAAVPDKLMKASGGLKRVYRDFLPLLLLTLSSQALYTIERAFASNMESGTLAGLSYAYRIAQFPNWVFAAAVTVVLLPALSRSAAPGGGGESMKPELYRALKAALGFMLLSAAVLYFLREPIISLLFGRGAFDSHSVSLTSELLAGYSLSIVGQVISGICLRYFLACGRLYGPAAIYLASMICTVLFDLLTMPALGPAALGYGALCGWALNALLLFILVVRDSNNRSE